jgi:hypothetical protein
MDNVKLGDKSKIGILDSTCINQASHTINLRKESKMYKDMTKKQSNKGVAVLSSKTRVRILLYIDKAMHAFVKEDKTTIKISYFFKVSFNCTFSCALKYNSLS